MLNRLLLLNLLYHSLVSVSGTSSTTSSSSTASSTPIYHRYIIVGSGPGGLQLSHYLDTAERDYLVLEKNSAPGSFFIKYPRWRQLISINKRAAGKAELDFSMRHDWNSLLPEPSHSAALAIEDNHYHRSTVPCLYFNSTLTQSTSSSNTTTTSKLNCYTTDYSSVDPQYILSNVGKGLQFREYSSQYYPEADRLVEYMNYWSSDKAPRGVVTGNTSIYANPMKYKPRPLNIRYNTMITRVMRHPDWTYSTPIPSSSSSTMSASMKKEMMMKDPSTIMPKDHTRSKEEYIAIAEGKPRFRLVTSDGQYYDCTYLIWAGGFQRVNPPEGSNIKEAINKGWVNQYINAPVDLDYYFNKSVLILGRGNAAFEYANNVLEVASMVHLLGRDTGRIKLAWETHYPGDVRSVHNHLLETYLLKSMDALAEAPFHTLTFAYNNETDRITVSDPRNTCQFDQYGRSINRCFFRREYDRIISCSGWQFEDSPFDEEIRPEYYMNKKHPSITAKYESINVPGLFFAGNLMHSHDAKKSSGGFIHGFRYLVRALHRILEEEEQIAYTTALNMNKPMNELAPLRIDTYSLSTSNLPKLLPLPVPSNTLPVYGWPRRYTTGLRSTAHTLLRLINTASGLYQMFGGLGAVIVLPPFTSTQAKGFTNIGPLAACHEPWSFFDENADTTYILQTPPPVGTPSKPVARDDPVQLKSDAIINNALNGGAIFEDVPIKLVQEKATLWQSQLIQASSTLSSLIPDPSTVGVEYIVLTLEFGTGSSSYVPESKRNIDPKVDPVGYLRATSEWTRDPFSLLRANATLENPETSHFLHPVMKYYNTAINTTHPCAEMHVIEDFHITWTMHVAHLLPVLRFVQDVGGRRARSALELQKALVSKSRKSIDTDNIITTSSGYKTGPYTMVTKEILTPIWMVNREGKDHTHELIDHIMLTQGAKLYYNGKSIMSGEGWVNQLSVNTSDYLRYHGPRILILHFMDPYPIPPTDEEMKYLDGARKEMDKIMSNPGFPSFSLPVNKPIPQLNAAQKRQMVETEQSLQHFYEMFTNRNPSVALVSVNARTGFERIQAEKFGVETVPIFKVYDAYRGMLDIPGGDFESSPKRLEYIVTSHLSGKEAFYNNQDDLIFPGYDRDILMRTLLNSGRLEKDNPELAAQIINNIMRQQQQQPGNGGNPSSPNRGGPPPNPMNRNTNGMPSRTNAVPASKQVNDKYDPMIQNVLHGGSGGSNNPSTHGLSDNDYFGIPSSDNNGDNSEWGIEAHTAKQYQASQPQQQMPKQPPPSSSQPNVHAPPATPDADSFFTGSRNGGRHRKVSREW